MSLITKSWANGRGSPAVTVSFWILLALGTLALLVGAVLALLFPHLFRVPAGEEESASVLVYSFPRQPRSRSSAGRFRAAWPA